MIISSDWLQPFSLRLTITLAHALWQGALIASLAAIIAAINRKSSAKRYWTYFIALVVLAICPFLTFSLLGTPASPPVVSETHETETYIPPIQSPQPHKDTYTSVDVPKVTMPLTEIAKEKTDIAPTTPAATDWRSFTPLITAAYFAGMIMMLCRLTYGLRGGQRLSKVSQPVTDPAILSALARQAKALKLTITPAIAYCNRVVVPTVIGVIKPTILLPLSFATGLTPKQVEMLLGHELAHIRRHDPLFNIIQRLIEAMLFFHPATWYLSRKIRLERENSCDDRVLATGGRAIEYAQSLVEVAQQGLDNKAPSLAAESLQSTGRPSQLRTRIKRLLGYTPHEQMRLKQTWLLSATLIIFTIAAAATYLYAESSQDEAQSGQADATNVPEDTASASTNIEDLAGVIEESTEKSKSNEAHSESKETEQLLEIIRYKLENYPVTSYEYRARIDKKTYTGRTLATYRGHIHRIQHKERGYYHNIYDWTAKANTGGHSQSLRFDFNAVLNENYFARWFDTKNGGKVNLTVWDHESVDKMGQDARMHHDDAVLFDPLMQAMGTGGQKLLELLEFDRHKGIRWDARRENIRGLGETIVLEARLTKRDDYLWSRFFIDPKKGFLCRRVEVFAEDGGVYRSNIQLEEVANGIWFPMHIEKKTEMTENADKHTISFTVNFDVQTIQVNHEIPPKQFEIGALNYPYRMLKSAGISHQLIDGTWTTHKAVEQIKQISRQGNSDDTDTPSDSSSHISVSSTSLHSYDTNGDTEEGALLFHGLDLSAEPVTTDFEGVPDLFEERPAGSKSYEVRDDVTVLPVGYDGTVYHIPTKAIFYVQHDSLLSSTLHYYGPFDERLLDGMDLENASVSTSGAIAFGVYIPVDLKGNLPDIPDVVNCASLRFEKTEKNDELHAWLGTMLTAKHDSKWIAELEIMDEKGIQLAQARQVFATTRWEPVEMDFVVVHTNLRFPLGRWTKGIKASRFRLALRPAPNDMVESLEAPFEFNKYTLLWLTANTHEIQPLVMIRGVHFDKLENGQVQARLRAGGKPLADTEWRIRLELLAASEILQSVETTFSTTKEQEFDPFGSNEPPLNEIDIPLDLGNWDDISSATSFRVSLWRSDTEMNSEKPPEFPPSETDKSVEKAKNIDVVEPFDSHVAVAAPAVVSNLDQDPSSTSENEHTFEIKVFRFDSKKSDELIQSVNFNADDGLDTDQVQVFRRLDKSFGQGGSFGGGSPRTPQEISEWFVSNGAELMMAPRITVATDGKPAASTKLIMKDDAQTDKQSSLRPTSVPWPRFLANDPWPGFFANSPGLEEFMASGSSKAAFLIDLAEKGEDGRSECQSFALRAVLDPEQGLLEVDLYYHSLIRVTRQTDERHPLMFWKNKREDVLDERAFTLPLRLRQNAWVGMAYRMKEAPEHTVFIILSAKPAKEAKILEIEHKLDTPVTITFEDIHIRECLDFIEEWAGISFVADPMLIEPKSDDNHTESDSKDYPSDAIVPYINLTDVTLRDALKALLNPLGLDYTVQPGFIRISALADSTQAPQADDKDNPIKRSLDENISLDFKNSHISDVINSISEETQINFIIDNRVVKPKADYVFPTPTNVDKLFPQFPKPPDDFRPPPNEQAYVTDGIVASITLKGIPLRDALQKLLKPLHLDYSVQPGFIWISSPLKMHLETFEELETRTYPLPKSKDNQELVELLEKVVPTVFDMHTGEKRTHVVPDEKSNSLVAHNTPTNLVLLDQILSLTGNIESAETTQGKEPETTLVDIDDFEVPGRITLGHRHFAPGISILISQFTGFRRDFVIEAQERLKEEQGNEISTLWDPSSKVLLVAVEGDICKAIFDCEEGTKRKVFHPHRGQGGATSIVTYSPYQGRNKRKRGFAVPTGSEITGIVELLAPSVSQDEMAQRPNIACEFGCGSVQNGIPFGHLRYSHKAVIDCRSEKIAEIVRQNQGAFEEVIREFHTMIGSSDKNSREQAEEMLAQTDKELHDLLKRLKGGPLWHNSAISLVYDAKLWIEP